MATDRLKFHLNLNEVALPWERHPALWQQYEQARADNAYKKKHPILCRLGRRTCRGWPRGCHFPSPPRW